MRWGAPYRDVFDKTLLRLLSGGLLQRAEQMSMESLDLDSFEGDGKPSATLQISKILKNAEITHGSAKEVAFSMSRLKTWLAYILLWGLSASCLVFSAEVCIVRLKKWQRCRMEAKEVIQVESRENLTTLQGATCQKSCTQL